MPSPLYIFLDESGDLGFTPRGSRHFMFGGIVKQRPFLAFNDLTNLKYDLLESGLEIDCFHACEDKQAVRDKVFRIIQNHLAGVRIEALIVEKWKTHPSLQVEERFYPEMLGYFLQHILGAQRLEEYSEVLVITDKLPGGKRGKLFSDTVQKTLRRKMPSEVPWRVLHHESQSCMDLQMADYCSWAIYRKWERRDFRSYDLIRTAIRKEFSIFEKGTKSYY